MRTALSLVAVIALAALTGLATPTGLAASHEDVVEIELVETADDDAPYAFEPTERTVDAGTTVRWVHTHDVSHTITSTDSHEEREPNGEFDETMSSEGDTFEFTFEEPGTYHFYCKPHSSFMVGTIHVEGEADGGGTADAPLGAFAAIVAGLAGSALLATRRVDRG